MDPLRGIARGGGGSRGCENQALLILEGVDNRKQANWYLGKKYAYVYRAKR